MKYNQPHRPTQIIAHTLIQKSIDKICAFIQLASFPLKMNQQSHQKQANVQKQNNKRTHTVQVKRTYPKQSRIQNQYQQQQTPYRKQSKSNYSNSISNLSSYHQKNIKEYSRVVQKQIKKQLSQRAQQFVVMLRERKKQLDGKFYLLKRAEMVRKRQKQRKLQVEKQVQRQIQKKIRKLNAQKNIQYYNQKKKLIQMKQSKSKNRSSSMPHVIQETQNRIKLPSIYNTQLEQIKQEGFTQSRIPDGLKKTVIRKNKRSYTQADSRSLSPDQQSRQIKLFNKNDQKPQSDNRSQYKQYLKMHEQSLNADKKCYLISKNLKEDIGDYLQKYNNLNELISLKKNDKVSKKQKNLILQKKLKKKLKPKSSYNQYNKYEQDQNLSEDQTVHIQ